MLKRHALPLFAICVLGLTPALAHAQFWEHDNRLLRPIDKADTGIGAELAIGDFNGDGIADLAHGTSYYDSAAGQNVGRWWYVRGSANRALSAMGSYYFTGSDEGWGASALVAGDFDGDGRDEVAIGRPLADVEYSGESRANAGTVLIQKWLVGSSWNNELVLSQLDTLNYTPPEVNDWFGFKLAVGDFDDDEFEDLVVAATHESWGNGYMNGIVHVFYGSAAGLRTDNDRVFAAGFQGLLGTPSGSDRLGVALAVGDFDDDGYDDLAFGAPHRTVAGAEEAGQVHVVFGSSTGLTTTGQQLLDDGDFLGGSPEAHDNFGQSLAAANFDEAGSYCVLNPCYDDLAIGVPGQAVLALAGAGKVWVAYGGPGGIGVGGATRLDQNGQLNEPETGDHFGWTLVAGQVDYRSLSRHADLVVGTPYEDFEGGVAREGMVHTFFGSSAGIDGGRQEQVLREKRGFACHPAEADDFFGEKLAIGDLDDDGWGDLVVGLRNKDGAQIDAGAVQILYGALFADGVESSTTDNW